MQKSKNIPANLMNRIRAVRKTYFKFFKSESQTIQLLTFLSTIILGVDDIIEMGGRSQCQRHLIKYFIKRLSREFSVTSARGKNVALWISEAIESMSLARVATYLRNDIARDYLNMLKAMGQELKSGDGLTLKSYLLISRESIGAKLIVDLALFIGNERRRPKNISAFKNEFSELMRIANDYGTYRVEKYKINAIKMTVIKQPQISRNGLREHFLRLAKRRENRVQDLIYHLEINDATKNVLSKLTTVGMLYFKIGDIQKRK